MFNVSIPTISKEEMEKRYEQIKPVVTVNGELYYFREFTLKELSSISYLWKRNENIGKKVKKGALKALVDKDFICLHSYGYAGCFKPSIAEILSQIKKEELPFAKAFEIIESPQTDSDLCKDSFTSVALYNGFHVSTVRLYG